MSHVTTFALVVDRVITIYPITYDDMNARNNPLEEYYQCYFNGTPVINNPTIEYIVEQPKLIGNAVFVDEVIQRKTLEEIFTLIGLGPGSTVTIAQVLPAHLEAVEILVKERTQGLLDAFAQTRGYDDIKSTCTYINSQIPSYAAEANRAIYLRDLTWATLYQYLSNVIAGTQPLPVDWAEIASILPALTWE